MCKNSSSPHLQPYVDALDVEEVSTDEVPDTVAHLVGIPANLAL